MARKRTASLRTVAPIAGAALFLEIGAWWWIGRLSSGLAPALAVSLGVAATALAAVLVWQLWRMNQLSTLELQRAKTVAARAIEHERSTEQAQREAEQASVLLVTALDALPIGIAIFDQHDRQVIRNRYLDELLPGLYNTTNSNETLGTMLRRELEMGVPMEATGHMEQWIEQQLAERSSQAQPILQKHADDRWIHTYEVRSPQGFTVVARAEVTELVRKEQLLAQANEQLALQSATDGLTGVANRRRFDEILSTEWARAARKGNSLSLLMFDIDHFKLFNDHYGHLAGDECLRLVSQVLTTCVRRAGEILARYGGEEFVMLMPGADLTQATEMARRCLSRIGHQAIPHGSSLTAPQVTFSIGVACVLPSGSREAETLVNAADTAMYRAKMAGRGRYEVADIADWEIDKDTHRSRPADLN